MGDDTLDPQNEKDVKLKKLLEDLLEWSHRKPNRDYAYSRCNFCSQSWWGENEEHRSDCFARRIRAQLRQT